MVEALFKLRPHREQERMIISLRGTASAVVVVVVVIVVVVVFVVVVGRRRIGVEHGVAKKLFVPIGGPEIVITDDR